LPRHIQSLTGDPNPGFLVQLNEPIFFRGLDQAGDFGLREILWAFEHPHSVIVDDKHNDVVQGMAAGYRAADKAHHNIPAARTGRVAGLIGEFGQRVAGDAARGKGEGRFFVNRQGLRGVRAPMCQRPAVQDHALAEAARTALLQGGQERVVGETDHHMG
jgi:hypothetical protein